VALSAGQRSDLARMYAPILVMHPKDPWMPIGAGTFLEICELWVSAAGDQTKLAEGGAIDAHRLGAAVQEGAYAAALDGPTHPVIYAWQLNRPYQKTGPRITTAEDNGFYLWRPKPWVNPDDLELADVPMYYEWKDDTRLCFWFCMAGSALPQNLIGMLRGALGVPHPHIAAVAPDGAPATASREAAIANLTMPASGLLPSQLGDLEAAIEFAARLDNTEEIHQGDWEGVTFAFNGETPTTVSLHQHGNATPVAFAQLELRGTRPVLYSGLGSHATVASPGTAGQETVATTANGKLWAPEGNRIRDAKQEPWFGFGGAWGERRFPQLGRFDAGIRHGVRSVTGFDVWEESTGPLGPSTYEER
jgi:hypothetical protein